MYCITCKKHHHWNRNGVACDFCGKRYRTTVETHLGADFGYTRYICAECIDEINDNNVDFEDNWKGYEIDCFGRSVKLLCGQAREELARKTVVVMRYGGGKMYSSDDEAIEAICEIENDHSICVKVSGDWYYKNVVAIFGDELIYLVVPNGITEDALNFYGDEARVDYAHENGELCGNARCEICFG